MPENSKPMLGAPPSCASASRLSLPYASITSLKFSAPAIAFTTRQYRARMRVSVQEKLGSSMVSCGILYNCNDFVIE